MGYKAVQFAAPPGSEIIGAVVQSWANNLLKDYTQPVFAQYRLNPENIDPQGWYNRQIVIDMLYQVYKSPAGPTQLIAIGKQGTPSVIGLLGVTTIEDLLTNIDKTITLFIRNVPAEYRYVVTRLGHQHYTFWNNTSSPNDLIYGNVWEAMRLLRQPHEQFTLAPISGYSYGSTEGATFELKWG